MIYYKKYPNKHAYVSCLKTDGGYKISKGESIVDISSLTSGFYVVIYQVKGTDDFYASVSGTYEESLVIKDSNGKEFDLQILEPNDKKRFIAIEHIEYTDDYSVFINDEPIYPSRP